ncbi:molybdenum cofactor guanylyltransferase [Marinobacter zhejiangensis]|uniref:Molybdenum cofactor guanylyltransferase n=1 Tax=Marinobacter zhejiangensis TaxID=488535 RepID=A0A1I4MCG0_9GAMM|nr:molybdenum cofactor guanylyltransferase [Marinobacter zhejiangensis]SFM01052.1 molybdopterin-guanine dinucleotide biosynthesis protein A [Marinobacter zhejiangensis]
MNAIGILLAGGEARRMGGVDKGRQLWQGAPMADSIAATFRAVLPELIVSTAKPDTYYAELATQLVTDDPHFRGQGPLAGLLTAMRRAGELGYSEVLVCPCDTPRVSAGLLQHLLDGYAAGDGRPVIADVDGRVHPLHGVYPVTLAAPLERQLLAGNRRVYQFALACGAHLLDCHPFQEDFTNCNRLDDLR